MEYATVISVIALLVSALAAIYARWAAMEAKQANRLVLHEKQAAILDLVVQFEGYFKGYGANPTFDQIEVFNREVVIPAKLYLPANISSIISEAYRIIVAQSMLVSAVEWDERKEHDYKVESKKMDDMVSLISAISEELQSYLRLESA